MNYSAAKTSYTKVDIFYYDIHPHPQYHVKYSHLTKSIQNSARMPEMSTHGTMLYELLIF